jgi:hypothetical protein
MSSLQFQVRWFYFEFPCSYVWGSLIATVKVAASSMSWESLKKGWNIVPRMWLKFNVVLLTPWYSGIGGSLNLSKKFNKLR